MRSKDKKYHLLYKTTNLLNGKYYYGIHSTNKIEDDYLGSGKRLRYSIRKYGKENFKREILNFFDNREELVQSEIDLLTRGILEDIHCMNLMKGGYGGFISVEQQKYRSQCGGKAFAEKLKNDKKFLKEHSIRSSKRMSELLNTGKIKRGDWNGKRHTEESKKKMSESKKGKQSGNLNGSYGTCWITKDNENKKIKKEELDNYIQLGWSKGRKLKIN